MSDQRLYTLYIPESAQASRSSSQSKRTSQDATITTDFGNVESTGTNPGSTPISGAYRGDYAELMAQQLNELSKAPNYNGVPYYTDDSNPLNDTYVSVDSFETEPADPRQDLELYRFRGRITEEGTLGSHFRATQSQPRTVDNPFDTGETDLIALPASATKVRWYDEKGQTSEPATVQSTLSGKFINVDTYSPDEATFDNPTLLSKIPSGDEGKIDTRVWDDFGRAQLDANGVNSWQKVFTTGHNFNGSAVVENGLLRLELDEDVESMSFEEWDNVAGSYSSVALGTSDWELLDFNFTRLSPTRTEGQIRFTDTVSGDFHSVNFQVNRASNRVLFFTPPNEDPIPTGLQTKLDPIAEDWTYTTQSVQTILPRQEVND